MQIQYLIFKLYFDRVGLFYKCNDVVSTFYFVHKYKLFMCVFVSYYIYPTCITYVLNIEINTNYLFHVSVQSLKLS